MSTGLPRPGLARSAHRGRIKFLRGYVSISSAAVNRPTHDHAASLSDLARTSMRSAFRGPAHQLAVRMRINNCTHGHYCPSNQPCTSNCTSAEGLHFSAFHYTMTGHLEVWRDAKYFPHNDAHNCIYMEIYVHSTLA